MDRRLALGLAGVVLVGLAAAALWRGSGPVTPPAPDDPRPNVLIVLWDTVRAVAP